MNVNELFNQGYEIIGTCCIADDAVEMANDCKGNYHDVHWCRYKRTPGKEDAYAIFCKNDKYFY